ncbi:Gfo/Idh/MocA family oxidoreductase [Nibrella saemangeumensis]|uniref:Gfo/Idh/MocA family oxidoreductase n=1 Tax=Nibrella saemangeumensis TaxID=1084526 RepID=A0ABP8MYU5_9BACT
MTRWGILGLGRIAHKFATDLLTLPDAELYAVASASAERAADFATQYNVPHHFGRYEDLLTCEGLDVVYIATPHVGHHAHTLLCLNSGLPVLCEKPFAMNARQVQEMVQTARINNVFLMEALWSRFIPSVQKALELIEAGAIGKVLGVRADFGFQAPFLPDKRGFNKDLGGGSLLDIGIYPLFLSYLILGKPQTIKASVTMSPTGVDEQCGMVLTYAGNQMAVLNSSFVTITRTHAFIYGETGNIYIHGRWHESQAVTLEPHEGDKQVFSFERSTWGYDYEAHHVMQCLREGHTESPLWTLDDSLNLIELLDAVRQEVGLWYNEDDLDNTLKH